MRIAERKFPDSLLLCIFLFHLLHDLTNEHLKDDENSFDSGTVRYCIGPVVVVLLCSICCSCYCRRGTYIDCVVVS